MRLNINADVSDVQNAKDVVKELQSMHLASGMDINVNIDIKEKHEKKKVGF